MHWQGNNRLIVCSSDGFMSVITFNSGPENQIGQRLSLDEIENVDLREHYQKLDEVKYEKYVADVLSIGKNQN